MTTKDRLEAYAKYVKENYDDLLMSFSSLSTCEIDFVNWLNDKDLLKPFLETWFRSDEQIGRRFDQHCKHSFKCSRSEA